MRRLTIKSGEKLTFENRTWNDCYADENRNACIRSVDGTSQDLRSFIKEMWCKIIDKEQVFPDDDDDFDDWMDEHMQYETVEGLLAYLYQQMYSKADLQNTLKHYEDKEERQTFEDDCGNCGSQRAAGKFRQIEIDIKGCQSEEHFYEIAKWMAKGLQEKCGCLFSMFEQPEGCRESGDYCEDCFKDNVHIYSEELNIEFDEWEG